MFVRLFASVLGLACLMASQSGPVESSRPRITLGWIGQSNMQGLCDRATMTRFVLPTDAQLRSAIEYYQVDMNGFTDREGRLTPMAFGGWSPAVQRLGGFDYQPNLLPSYYGTGRGSFGPDLAASYLTGLAFGVPVTNVKLALGNTFLTAQQPVVTTPFAHLGSYLWLGSFHCFDTSLPWGGNDNAFHASRATSGTVSSATSFVSGFASMTDDQANWIPDQWVGYWVRAGGCLGLITSNDANTLAVLIWAPTPISAPRVMSSYSIERRVRRDVSLARSFVDGYCERTKALLEARGEVMDMRVIGIQIGENDSRRLSNALLVKQRMTDLIAWLRAELHRRGMTTMPRHKIGVVLGYIKDNPPWTHASVVNAAYRDIAAADPFVMTSGVGDVEVGGIDPVASSPGFDPLHYSADGQIVNGIRFAERILALIGSQ